MRVVLTQNPQIQLIRPPMLVGSVSNSLVICVHDRAFGGHRLAALEGRALVFVAHHSAPSDDRIVL
jgi:hypothetical protein